MLRVSGDTLGIEIAGRIADRIVVFWHKLTLPKISLLPEFDEFDIDPATTRFIARRRRRCTLNGHMWEFKRIQMDHISYVVECSRCHPHIDSRRVIVSYNPFPMVERKTD